MVLDKPSIAGIAAKLHIEVVREEHGNRLPRSISGGRQISAPRAGMAALVVTPPLSRQSVQGPIRKTMRALDLRLP